MFCIFFDCYNYKFNYYSKPMFFHFRAKNKSGCFADLTYILSYISKTFMYIFKYLIFYKIKKLFRYLNQKSSLIYILPQYLNQGYKLF